jgi:hypothetical protein
MKCQVKSNPVIHVELSPDEASFLKILTQNVILGMSGNEVAMMELIFNSLPSHEELNEMTHNN